MRLLYQSQSQGLGLYFTLLICSLVQGVFSKPQPDAKSAWVRTRSKKILLKNTQRWSNGTFTSSATNAGCTDSGPSIISAPKENIWAGLTDIEAAGVTSWLFTPPALNLTLSDDAGSWDNSVQVCRCKLTTVCVNLHRLLVELLQPNKTNALRYFDNDDVAPLRYAHVVLDNRATPDPYYQDIQVGPLPATYGTTTWVALEYPYTRKTRGRIRNLNADSDGVLYSQWLHKISATISDITLDLWGGTALGLENDTLDIWGIDPLWQDDGRVVRWDTFWNLPTDEYDAETLLPLGLYFSSDVTGRDPSQWSLLGWLYKDIFYETTEEFREAYYSPNFVKLGANVEGDWARTDRTGDVLPLDTCYPPTMVAPTGARYNVDYARKYVGWMDFTFYIGFSRDIGMTLYNIACKGQRIMYELGLQEALAHYAGNTLNVVDDCYIDVFVGNDPVQSGTSSLDSYYGFGPSLSSCYQATTVPGLMSHDLQRDAY